MSEAYQNTMFHVEQFTSKKKSVRSMTESSGRLSEKQIEVLLHPYILPGASVPPGMYGQLSAYLDLLVRWNARTNLTAIREPEEMVRRHFGESLFAAQHLGECETLLDFGSGAGFPGLPIQLFLPHLRVTLAESQNKKAAFLREVIRTLGLKTDVWAGRVEALPATTRFDTVTLRAVDNMGMAIMAASSRATRQMLLLTTPRQELVVAGFAAAPGVPIPGSKEQELVILNRVDLQEGVD